MSNASTSTQLETEKQRIERYLGGDAEMAELVQAWISSALSRRFAFVGFDREDLCQAVHAKLLANLQAGRFRHGSTLETYVARVTDYTAIDLLRRRYREREAPVGPVALHSSDPHRVAVARDERRKLYRAMLECPEPCRELWRLVLLDELSYTEIAERLGVAPGTVKSRVSRCREKLDGVLERLGWGALRPQRSNRGTTSGLDRGKGAHEQA